MLHPAKQGIAKISRAFNKTDLPLFIQVDRIPNDASSRQENPHAIALVHDAGV